MSMICMTQRFWNAGGCHLAFGKDPKRVFVRGPAGRREISMEEYRGFDVAAEAAAGLASWYAKRLSVSAFHAAEVSGF